MNIFFYNFSKKFGCYCLINAAKLPSEITFPTLLLTIRTYIQPEVFSIITHISGEELIDHVAHDESSRVEKKDCEGCFVTSN